MYIYSFNLLLIYSNIIPLLIFLRHRRDVGNAILGACNDKQKFTDMIESIIKYSTATAPKRDAAGMMAISAQPII